MAKARCPECDALVGISPTGEKQSPDSLLTSMWWRIDVHKKPDEEKICEGSGKRV